MKNVQYIPYLRPNRGNFRVSQEIGVEELDSDVKFYTGNGNMPILRMHNEKCAI